MNDSLVILLLLCFSICHGKEQDYSPPSGILPTTKYQNKVETSLRLSCPDPADIEPCKCKITPSGTSLEMNCDNVQDEEELRKVFSAISPTNEFYTFTMSNNHGVKVLEDGVFGDVSFRVLDIFECDLETVEIDALTASFSRLTNLDIKFCKLEIFQFERLTDFTNLRFLHLIGNKIHTVPPLSSSSLWWVDLGWNLITYLSPNTFTLLPEVKVIELDGNHLTEIAQGTFMGLTNLRYVAIRCNNISYLQSLTFGLKPTSYNAKLYLDNNYIEYVEVDAFKGVGVDDIISMNNNTLTRLPEEVWRPVLEKNITVHLQGNDLACGCDVDWLVKDPQLLTMASDARCADGTLLTDLNPADFDICG